MAVKEESQNDNDLNSNDFLARFFHRMDSTLERIAKNTNRVQVPIDEYLNDIVAGVVTLTPQVHGPWVLTDVIANWQILPPTITAEASFAAGVAANVSLPAGYAITGFTVTAASAAAAENGTVTVTNVPNGPIVYDFTIPNAGNSTAILNENFPGPLAPTGGAPNVAISAITGGTAGHIIVYGALVQTAAVSLTIGERIITPPVSPGWFSLSLTKGMLIDNDKPVKLAISPAAPLFLEVLGYSDIRKMQ